MLLGHVYLRDDVSNQSENGIRDMKEQSDTNKGENRGIKRSRDE